MAGVDWLTGFGLGMMGLDLKGREGTENDVCSSLTQIIHNFYLLPGLLP